MDETTDTSLSTVKTTTRGKCVALMLRQEHYIAAIVGWYCRVFLKKPEIGMEGNFVFQESPVTFKANGGMLTYDREILGLAQSVWELMLRHKSIFSDVMDIKAYAEPNFFNELKRMNRETKKDQVTEKLKVILFNIHNIEEMKKNIRGDVEDEEYFEDPARVKEFSQQFRTEYYNLIPSIVLPLLARNLFGIASLLRKMNAPLNALCAVTHPIQSKTQKSTIRSPPQSAPASSLTNSILCSSHSTNSISTTESDPRSFEVTKLVDNARKRSKRRATSLAEHQKQFMDFIGLHKKKDRITDLIVALLKTGKTIVEAQKIANQLENDIMLE